MGTDSGHRLLELAVSEPGPQPLHVAVTQQAACVQDTENTEEISEMSCCKICYNHQTTVEIKEDMNSLNMTLSDFQDLYELSISLKARVALWYIIAHINERHIFCKLPFFSEAT